MADLCPSCGFSIDFKWEADGVSLSCSNCSYKTRAAYQSAYDRRKSKRTVPMDRIFPKEPYDAQ